MHPVATVHISARGSKANHLIYLLLLSSLTMLSFAAAKVLTAPILEAVEYLAHLRHI